ncbi:RelA/SpoT family protein [Pseudomonas sp. 2FG]|uniref:RelA/SpoT family protein n=1 Tax=Pseudomonas sp. 2FG TaxID=2502191 RepID=UPI0010F90687|nr:RelA/SpoT family protein [Pseudomonas sp. 2FG]
MYNSSEMRVAKQLQETIESELARLGLLCRVFSRAKSDHSMATKLEREPGKYSSTGKKIQDMFGVRVALYFLDDQKIAIDTLKKTFTYDDQSSTIDAPTGSSFSATRCNLIFHLPEALAESSTIFKRYDCLDKTFEVQIRTVLSEGWHEVEHDLRFKCKEDWENHTDLDRALNGIYASLETSDWSMLKLLEDLAYRHYKSSEWTQMLRAKFRLRSNGVINSGITAVLNEDTSIGKLLYRVDRTKLMEKLANNRISLPITPDNIVFLCNFYFVKSEKITALTPHPILDIFEEA